MSPLLPSHRCRSPGRCNHRAKVPYSRTAPARSSSTLRRWAPSTIQPAASSSTAAAASPSSFNPSSRPQAQQQQQQKVSSRTPQEQQQPRSCTPAAAASPMPHRRSSRRSMKTSCRRPLPTRSSEQPSSKHSLVDREPLPQLKRKRGQAPTANPSSMAVHLEPERLGVRP